MFDINLLVSNISEAIWGWPLLAIFMGVGVLVTVMLRFVQFRFFTESFKLVFSPKDRPKATKSGEMTPFQAFINALGTSTGNGSIAGIGTAIYMGGPGAAFWILIAGVFALALRFAEVFLATYVIGKYKYKTAEGGPMVYLSRVPGGTVLPYLFAISLLFYSFTSGSAMQANSIGLGISRILGLDTWITAIVLGLFVIYVMLGGAERILKISDKLVPFKVGVFIVSSLIVLVYHYANLGEALRLMWLGAFTPAALGGAGVGFTVQQAMRNGIARSLNAHESGLGVAATLFGSTGSKEPMKDSIMSMLGTFISTYVVCFVVALCIVMSGVWNNGLSSAALTISAFETVFGVAGGWVVTFCAASFGLGCLVSFIFIARDAWLFLTNGRWVGLCSLIYIAITVLGTMAKVDIIWNLNDIVNGLMFVINLYGIIYFLPMMRQQVSAYINKAK